MRYRTLGNTQIEVSLICLGSMTWGEQNTQDQAYAQMDMAVEAGINFFDAAEMYPVPPKPETVGATETIMGNWLQDRAMRDQIILATKVAGRSDHNRGVDHIRGGARLNKQQLEQALDGSLRRLKTDYIDLYQIHWPERKTNFFGRLGYVADDSDDGIPLEETLEVLNGFVSAGKIRYIGLSNETPWGMLEAMRLTWTKSFEKVQSIQNPYNLLNRSFEIGCAEIALREKISLLAYSPLAFGTLSGKYLNAQKPENARLTLYDRFSRYSQGNAQKATQAYVELAHSLQLSPAQLALAYVNQSRFVTANVIGATTVHQLQENIESINVQLCDEALNAIERIYQQYSNPSP